MKTNEMSKAEALLNAEGLVVVSSKIQLKNGTLRLKSSIGPYEYAIHKTGWIRTNRNIDSVHGWRLRNTNEEIIKELWQNDPMGGRCYPGESYIELAKRVIKNHEHRCKKYGNYEKINRMLLERAAEWEAEKPKREEYEKKFMEFYKKLQNMQKRHKEEEIELRKLYNQ